MREAHRLYVQLVQPGRGFAGLRRFPGAAPQLCAVQAGGGQPQGGEQLVQLRQRTATDQCHGAIKALADAGYPVADAWRQAYVFRLCGEPDQCAVDIEEQCTRGIQRGGQADGRFEHAPTMPCTA